MGWNETPVTVVGYVISDVVHRYTNDGVSVANFRVCSTERRYNREQQEWVDGDKLFLGVSCWRRLADNARTTLAKGDPVIVHGKLRHKVQDADGERRQFYSVDAVAMGLDLSRVHTLTGASEIVAPRTEDESVEADAPAERETIPF